MTSFHPSCLLLLSSICNQNMHFAIQISNESIVRGSNRNPSHFFTFLFKFQIGTHLNVSFGLIVDCTSFYNFYSVKCGGIVVSQLNFTSYTNSSLWIKSIIKNNFVNVDFILNLMSWMQIWNNTMFNYLLLNVHHLQ